MDRSLLKKILDERGIPKNYYNLDMKGEVDQKVCLVYEAPDWLVYYSEKGKKFDITKFKSEDDACYDVLKRLTE